VEATSHLSLTAGLRYTYLGVPYEIDGQQVAPTINLSTFLQTAHRSFVRYSLQYANHSLRCARRMATNSGRSEGELCSRVAFAYSTPTTAPRSVRLCIGFRPFGEGVVNYYDANGAFALQPKIPSHIQCGHSSSFHRIPQCSDWSRLRRDQDVPITPADQNFSFVRSINSNIKTPYAETFNLTVQHEFARGLTVTGSYVGRLGRHILSNLDVAHQAIRTIRQRPKLLPGGNSVCQDGGRRRSTRNSP